MTPPNMLAVVGAARGVVLLEAVDGAKVGDGLQLRIYQLGERVVRITAIGHGVMTCGTYSSSTPWDLPGDLISFVELVEVVRAAIAPVITATVTPTAMSTAGTPTSWSLIVSASDYAKIGTPVARYTLVVARAGADGAETECLIFRVTERLDSARHPSIDRVELAVSLPIASYRALSTVEITDARPPPPRPNQRDRLLRGEGF
ncbi:MAG: hypothetical protein NT062_31925 [Proteobacteria bacterium]|nr:hypothetical protein [Pseudomonadota bacterium]